MPKPLEAAGKDPSFVGRLRQDEGVPDDFSYDYAAEAIRAQITADFERLTTALPDARFTVVEPFW